MLNGCNWFWRSFVIKHDRIRSNIESRGEAKVETLRSKSARL